MQECSKAPMHSRIRAFVHSCIPAASSDANEDVGDEDEQEDEKPDLLRTGQHWSNARMQECTNAQMRWCIRALVPFVHFVIATEEFRYRKTSP